MELQLGCYPCLITQALKTAQLIGLNPSQTKAAVEHVLQLLLADHTNQTAPHIAAGLYQFIRTEFFRGDACFDPYRELKRATNKKALGYLEHLFGLVERSAAPLETAVKVAAAGNIIDFGAKAHGDIDIDYEIKNIDGLTFQVFDFGDLKQSLQTAKTLLYLGDNAGEIVFDQVFIAEIKKEYPAIAITFAVRDKPILNDVTFEDAAFTGMDALVTVISSGSIYPGTVLPETSPAFQRLFYSADSIIAKGQGNYETLSDEAKNNLYFLLRIKCDAVAQQINARPGSLVLWKRKCAVCG